MKTRITVREARRSISQILNEGSTAPIGDEYRELRGFLVGIPKHDRWNKQERKKALAQAKANFTAAWNAEAKN